MSVPSKKAAGPDLVIAEAMKTRQGSVTSPSLYNVFMD